MKKNFIKFLLAIFLAFPLSACNVNEDVVISYDADNLTVYADDVATLDLTNFFTITVNGKEVQVKQDYIFGTVGTDGGSYPILVTYKDSKILVNITVIGSDSVNIACASLAKTVYASDVETTDFKSLFTLKVKGVTQTITDDMITSTVTNVPGDYTYSVTCNGVTKTMVVHVIADSVEPVTLTCSTNGTKITKTNGVTLIYQVYNAKNTNVKVEFSGQGAQYVEFDKTSNKVVMKDGAEFDGSKTVNVTITSIEDETVYKVFKMIVQGNTVSGSIGNLTSAMIAEIANPSITVTGTLTDVFYDMENDEETDHTYNMTVEMEDGKWMGQWAVANEADAIVTTNYYQRGSKLVTNYEGTSGYPFEEVYIGKNNTKVTHAISDYMSDPTLWEDQHLWNCLDSFKIDNFTVDTTDAVNDAYVYNPDFTTIEDGEEYAADLWLYTYMSYAFTPMLSDTLDEVVFYVKDGHISGMKCSTEILYDNETAEDSTEYSYSYFIVEFSKVGTTTVSDPTPYSATTNADKLQAAVDKMKTANNYTFKCIDTAISEPSYDEDDYSLDSTSSANVKSRNIKKTSDASSSTTTKEVGIVGYVTEDAIEFVETAKYSATLSEDDDPYYTTTTGYKQIDEDHYDSYGYAKLSTSTADNEVYGLKGLRSKEGNISSLLPTWDFDVNIFQFTGTSVNTKGKTIYNYKLKDQILSSSVGKEMIFSEVSGYASSSTTVNYTISVDEDGNLVRIVMPYGYLDGLYTGYYTITFSDFGTTAFAEDHFATYENRVMLENWADYTCKYYSPDFSTLTTGDADCSIVLNAIYGENADLLPPPTVFFSIFGDAINGPFYDWKDVETVTGDTVTHGYMSINGKIEETDEHSHTTAETRDAIYDKLVEKMGEYGFVVDAANTNYVKGYGGTSSRTVAFVNGNITVAVEFYNANAFLYIDFYNTGDWSLRK